MNKVIREKSEQRNSTGFLMHILKIQISLWSSENLKRNSSRKWRNTFNFCEEAEEVKVGEPSRQSTVRLQGMC
jgi:hypothetical protein